MLFVACLITPIRLVTLVSCLISLARGDSDGVLGQAKEAKAHFDLSKGRRASVAGVSELPKAEISESESLHQAARAFMCHLRLSSEELILDKLTIRDYKVGEHLTTQNDPEHVNQLYFIIWGEEKNCTAGAIFRRFDVVCVPPLSSTASAS